MILCITGMPGSGKTELAKILGRKGFAIYEMSKPIIDKLNSEGLPLTNENKGAYANQHRKETGKMDIFAREAIPELNKLDGRDIVIVGLRSNKELEYFKHNLSDIVTIAIVAAPELRFRRLTGRGRDDDKAGFHTFLHRDARERSYGIEQTIEDADYTIFVDDTHGVLNMGKEIDELIAHIRKSMKDSGKGQSY